VVWSRANNNKSGVLVVAASIARCLVGYWWT
jgi:hypothetical protein